MAAYEYNERIKFMLPSGFIFERDVDDEGNEVVRFLAGKYEDDEGEIGYQFNCLVNCTEYDPEEFGEAATSDNLIDLLAERVDPSKCMKLADTPKTILLNKELPLLIFGNSMNMYVTIGLIQVSDWAVLKLQITSMFQEDEPSENTKVYENLYEVLKAVRIDKKKLPIEKIMPSQIEEELQLTFDEDGETRDILPKINFNLINGDETTTYEFTPEGMREIGKEYLTLAEPDEDQYPHYEAVRFAGNLNFPGATVIVNASGMEYEFLPIRNALERDEEDEEEIDEHMKAVYRRIIDKDTEKYDLHKRAKEMQKLFHVNASAFDPRHDRECELEEGYMQRAYMMSGLRSFAWTLADYCKQHDCTPSDIDCAAALRIVNFVAELEWLNYDGKTYCQGLCSGSDLHVFYIPDGVSKTDRKKLLPSKEEEESVKRMKETFPSYCEIPTEVHSLNALRKDLAYIYPAVKTLWDHLEEERDYDEALLGNEADIVYAWCALALAAKEPFFTEDGPMTCFFRQSAIERTAASRSKAKEGSRTGKKTEDWMSKYGAYVEIDPVIDFHSTIFVFAGLTGYRTETDHPIVRKVIEKGGQYRTGVSGLTNYLVVNPRNAGEAKIKAAVEQRKKGKKIKVILLEDLENVLEESSPEKRNDSSKSSASKTAAGSTEPKTAASNYAEPNQETGMDPDASQETQTAKKEGCYIATAVYGSYDAPEVMTLRRFRDETLRRSAFGRWFIRTYYRLSPPVAKELKNAKHINALVRSILDKWVERLNRKQ